MTDEQKYNTLKELILNEDRESVASLKQKITELEQQWNSAEEVSKRIDSLVENKIETFAKGFPKTMGPIITEALEVQMKNSKESIVNLLFPIIGKMIKKYVQQEIQLLSEAINSKMQNTFSLSKFKRKFKALFFRINENEILLSEQTSTQIEQIFLIEKDTGFLIENISKNHSLDPNLIAGMLTAIKNFMADAFIKNEQTVEFIHYEFNTICVKDFYSYYLAVVVNGVVDAKFKTNLDNSFLEFAENFEKNKWAKEQLKQNIEKYILNHAN